MYGTLQLDNLMYVYTLKHKARTTMLHLMLELFVMGTFTQSANLLSKQRSEYWGIDSEQRFCFCCAIEKNLNWHPYSDVLFPKYQC